MSIKKSLLMSLLFVAGIAVFYFNEYNENETLFRPTRALEHEEDEDEEMNEAKTAPWSVENAERHQKLIEKYMTAPSRRVRSGMSNYADGAITGQWKNRGAKNMPGAFKFAEMLDGTDTIYGVTHNHYSGEFNSKSYIFKGTIYNSKSGTKGDDFVRLTGHWPNRYQDLIAIKVSGKTRLIAGIENGPLYWSDNDGQTWTKSTGLPSVLKSTIANRQESNRIYTTDGTAVYSSDNGGESFTLFQNFGSSASSVLYSPRYDGQSDAENVYLVRSGTFYTRTSGSSSFTQKGSFISSHGTSSLSIGGDSRKLYVTEYQRYWVSTNGGVSWTQKYPKGNWYGDRTGEMSAGKYIAVSPENENHVIGGYAQPVYSTNGLDSDVSDDAGWGGYQNGTSLPADQYYNRIRFNYHPDFQASHFFYNSSGDLFSARCSDGGIFISYKEWYDHPVNGNYDNSGYTNGHFININTLNTTCPLIYRNNMFTGYKDETHIIYSTQDQGTQSIIPGTSGEALDFYQSIGGDGPPLNSADGLHVWKWQREGGEVWAPAQMYDASGNMRSASSVNGLIGSNSKATFTKSSNMGWIQTYIDHDAPDKRMWLLSKRLDRAEVNSWDGLDASSVTKGTGHQVAAIAQAHTNPDLVWFLQEGNVYKSTNRGDSFDNGVVTPFTKTSNKQNFGGGWVLPTDDNWILFCGPSANGTGAILSKDGGSTWKDVTGSFPAGDDAQTGGVVGSPDGKYVFAGTDIGPWVFVVATETWYPIGEGSAYFNTTAIEYIESTNTVRFGTWGSGVWDFSFQDGSIDPFVKVISPNGGESYQIGETVSVRWNSFVDGDVEISLYKEGTLEEVIATVPASDGSYLWTIDTALSNGTEYSIQVESASDGSLVDESDSPFTILAILKLDQKHLSIYDVDSEESSQRSAANTIDGDISTIWHTAWSQSLPDFPHHIVYEVDTTVPLIGFEYVPRQDGANGTVVNYEILFSNDGVSWTSVVDSALPVSQSGTTTLFDNAQSARYVKFLAKSEVNGNKYASMSEFNLFYTKGDKDPVAVKEVAPVSKGINILSLSSNSIKLAIPVNGSYRLELFTLNGRKVVSKQLDLSAGVQVVDLSGYNLGSQIMLLRFTGSGGELSRKIRL